MFDNSDISVLPVSSLALLSELSDEETGMEFLLMLGRRIWSRESDLCVLYVYTRLPIDTGSLGGVSSSALDRSRSFSEANVRFILLWMVPMKSPFICGLMYIRLVVTDDWIVNFFRLPPITTRLMDDF